MASVTTYLRNIGFVLIFVGASAGADAQPTQGGQPVAGTQGFEEYVDVVAPTPVPGVDLPVTQVAAPVQTASSKDLANAGALDMSDFLRRRAASVQVNELQGNPFQMDVNFRGYTASPLLGTPQGLSVYMDGVRMNQPFGEVVSWDLIPRLAIASSALMPGSNPLFGLNTLGGALALQTKDGLTSKGTSVQGLYGSHIRRSVEMEHGGATRDGSLAWYGAAHLFGERGWREDSPSDVRQFFGKVSWRRGANSVTASGARAVNTLTGNGLQEFRLLDRNYADVYTRPDTTNNRSTLVNATFRRARSERLTLAGNLYYRTIDTTSVNGDVNEAALSQSVYQPSAAERAALLAAGYTNIPASGADATTTPFPYLRCAANVLLNDEPGEKCTGLINRTASRQRNGGASGQATWRLGPSTRQHQVTAGAAVDRSTVGFDQSAELGYINPDRTVTGTGAYADGVTGGNVDGVPFDTRVGLDGTQQTWSLFAADTLSLGARWHLSASARYNRTRLDNRDRINPGGGDTSLDGTHVSSRLNPALGLTVDASHNLNVYAGYSEGSRAATSIEVGCANPAQPCKLPNAMAGDPPLEPVVTHTLEAGLRGVLRTHVEWHAGVYRAENNHDIMFVASGASGFGYFANVGSTRRQGIEVGVSRTGGRTGMGASYSFLSATYQSAEVVSGTGNSSNEDASAGRPGLESTIDIAPGDRLPLIPRHTLKAWADVKVSRALSVDLDLSGVSGALARGNENGAHVPDGVYYLGPGGTSGYAVMNAGARYRVTARLELFARLDNLLNRRYETAAQLGPTAFSAAGTLVARQFPAVSGEYPVQQSTFVAPGAPRAAYIGTRVRF